MGLLRAALPVRKALSCLTTPSYSSRPREAPSPTWSLPLGGVKRLVESLGRPNAVCQAADGSLWITEVSTGSVIGLSPEGDKICQISAGSGLQFMWPNDLVFGPDGLLYFTDSGMTPGEFMPGGSFNPDFQQIAYDGRVFAYDPRSGTVRLIDRGIRLANGLAFDVGGRLCVAETLSGNIYGYDVTAEKPVRVELGCVKPGDVPQGLCGPDGIRVGRNGLVYCAMYGLGHIAVLDPVRKIVLYRLPTIGKRPTNLVLGHDGTSTIYVTEAEVGTVEAILSQVSG